MHKLTLVRGTHHFSFISHFHKSIHHLTTTSPSEPTSHLSFHFSKYPQLHNRLPCSSFIIQSSRGAHYPATIIPELKAHPPAWEQNLPRFFNMADIHRRGLIRSHSGILQSAKYSDLTVRCGSEEFKIHRAIVCPRSKFFAAACDGQFRVHDFSILHLVKKLKLLMCMI